jgi:Spy/CpxP family protein refolding chaperone
MSCTVARSSRISGRQKFISLSRWPGLRSRGVHRHGERIVRLVSAGLVVVAVTVSATESAYTQAYQWWRDVMVQRELALTADQVTRLEAVFVSTLADRRKLRHELDQLERTVEQMIARADLDESQASSVIEQLEGVRAERNVARTLMLFKMYRILSPKQRQRLAKRPDKLRK